MSDLQVTFIDSLTEDENLQLIADKVQFSDRIQLNCEVNTHGIKIEAPENKEYTLIMPENLPSTNQFLRVKSIDGNVAQLEFVPLVQSYTANDLTSGTLALARYPTSGINGASLELIGTEVVTADNQKLAIAFINLEDDTVYRMVGNINFGDLSGGTDASFPDIEWLDENGTAQGDITWSRWYGTGDTVNSKLRSYIDCQTGSNTKYYSFTCDFYTKAGLNWFMFSGMNPRFNSAKKAEIYATFDNTGVDFNTITKRIHGIKITSNHGDYLNIGTNISLYKYREN